VTLALPTAWAFALVLFRTGGLLVAAPVLGSRSVPPRVKLGLALALSFAAFAGAGSPGAAPPESMGALAGLAIRETAFGALGGLAARMTLQVALAAGQLAGVATGMGFGAMLDPSSGAESNALGELLHTLAQAGAIALGLHREAIAWLAASVRRFPPGADAPLRELAERAIFEATGAAALAVRLGFPILAAVLLGHVAMAVTSRMAPQLSLQHVGFSVAIAAGGFAFYLVAPAIADAVARAAVASMSP
jgi:flagellar biosynthetic protein FliR